MRLPFSYNLRNLWVRRGTTLMTALGIGLTVAVLLSILALVGGLRNAFASTGVAGNVLVMRQSAESELSSNFTREQFQDLKLRPGIQRDATGQALASLELVSTVLLDSVDYEAGINISIRGLKPNPGFALRPEIKIAAGRWFSAGKREVTVGKNVARRNPEAQLGKDLRFGKGAWRVVGVFDAGESAANSEIWADLDQVCSDDNRCDTLSSALVRVEPVSNVGPFIQSLKDDQRLKVGAMTEQFYYEQQSSSAAPIQFLGIFIALVMAVGSSFAAMNTMYAAVARRSREIGTLRVLGFSRFSVLLSFFLESLVLALLGGIVGCLLVLPLDGFTTGIGSLITFSEVAFRFKITPEIMLMGIGFALFMGALGGLLPAAAAARKQILDALRDI
ncbi:MAG: ABC transporter permease [Bryobacteraceae bacterium]|nr:ABC transporter permease [Bryobacteraceae bacterium]